MNRRSFLMGLGALLVVSSLPGVSAPPGPRPEPPPSQPGGVWVFHPVPLVVTAREDMPEGCPLMRPKDRFFVCTHDLLSWF
jgi:hypothetical protein